MVIYNNKLPPHDISAEEATLGSLILDGSLITDIKFVNDNDFYHEPLKDIYNACLNLYKQGRTIDQITLAQELDRLGKIDKCGGVAYLEHIAHNTPTPLDIKSYAQIVRSLSISRQLINLGKQCVDIGYKAHPDNKQSIQTVYNLITDFKKNNMPSDGLLTPKDTSNMMFEMLNKYGEPLHSISWGFYELNRITSGIYPAELIVIGSRPSVGKTQLMLDIAEEVANQGKTVLFCSVEMSMNAVLERRVSREMGISVLELRARGLTQEQRDKLVNMAGENSERNIYYMHNGASSSDIFNEAMKLKENIGLDIIFIDYLQFLKDCWQTDRENQNVRVGKASKTLKTIANELNIPVIVASQLNRSLEHRGQEDRHPTLADLRDSGNIEQDADVVFLLDREVVTEGDVIDDTTLLVKMAKNRQMGTAPVVKLKYDLDTRRYVNIGVVHHEEGLL